MKMIYMDNAAMMKPIPEVTKAVCDCMNKHWFNPSSVYGGGRRVKELIEESRKNVADLIGADPSEIHFTSGSTESANILLKSLASYYDIYISEGEHPAIDSCIEDINCAVIPIDDTGMIKYKVLPTEGYDYGHAVLFAIAANNEVGTINPLKEIGMFCADNGFLFGSDLTQAVGHMQIDVKAMHIDFAFGSGQKFGGLSGSGFLYVNNKYKNLISPLCKGGGQDIYKSGTENIVGIIAMGKAAKYANENLICDGLYLAALRDYMINSILNTIPNTVLIGHPTKRLPNSVVIGFENMDSESIVEYLDVYDICASAGSACHTNSVEPSHVLKAMRLPDKYINGCVRFTLSTDNTRDDVDEVVRVLNNFYKSIGGKNEL